MKKPSPPSPPATLTTTTPSSPAASPAPAALPQVSDPQQELASRILSRRRLLPFVQRINPRYKAGWVHKDICRRLEKFSQDVAEQRSPRLMILMPPRHGKQLAHDTPILTPSGWTTHGALQPGDHVFSPSGQPVEVVAVSQEAPQDCEIEFFDGSVLRCHERHEWTVYDRARAAWRTVETRYLESQALTAGNRARFQLPATSALQTTAAELPIEPYFLGAWLGDGKSSAPVLCGAEADMDVIAAHIGHTVGARWVHGGTGVRYQNYKGLTKPLRELGVLGDKHIPQRYMLASEPQRRMLLAGLVDTDGSVELDTGRVRFRSGSERLANDVAQLVRSLGYRASTDYTPADTRDRAIKGGPSWCVQWTPHDGLGGGRLPRKASRRLRDRRRVGVKAVRRVAPTMGRCIQVDAHDGLYLAGLHLTPTHNSELASRSFPAWHLGHYPDHEFIAASYNVSLAMAFSRKVKEVLLDPGYAGVFDTRLHPDFQAAEEWAIAGHRGGYVAAGVGGGITGKGAHCLHPKTLIATEAGEIDIEHLYQLKSLPRVETPFGLCRVLAATKRPAPQLYTLRFASGAVVRTTAEHPVFLLDEGRYRTVGEIYGEAAGDDRVDMRVVRRRVPAPALRPREVDAAGVDGVLLQQGMQPGAPRGEEREALRGVRQAGRGHEAQQERALLQRGVRAEPGEAGEALLAMRRGVSAEIFHAGLLRGELRQYGARDPYAWAGELELSHGQRVRVLVRPDEASDPGAGQGLRGMRDHEEPALPPHQRGSGRQLAGEPGDAVPGAPHGAPQICADALLVVERDGGCTDFVYDLQVEEAGCFFAGDILVGNCLLIDDPIKNAEEADSADLREKLWEWYTSTAYTRLAPGGGVLVIQTCWHDADLAGKIQQAMAADPEADQFEIVKYPAIAEFDEWLDEDTDAIVEEQPAHGRRLRLKGEPLHEERYDLKRLLQIKRTLPPRWWSALYQQNPVPDEGIYFTKDMFRTGPLPDLQQCYVTVAFDFAISEKDQNDYTVGTVTLLDSDDVLHFADRVRFKSADADFIIKAIVSLCRKWHNPSIQLGVEDGQIYRAISAPLKREMARQRYYPSLQLLKPITDKQARARTLQGRMQQGMVSFSDKAEWYDSMRTEMLRFPSGVHDDQVDSAAWNAILVADRAPPPKPRETALKSWKDRLTGAGHGTHMVA